MPVLLVNMEFAKTLTGVTFVIVTLAGKEKLVVMISTNVFILVHRNDFGIFRFSSKPSGEFRVGSISDWVNFGSGQFRVGSATSWVSLGLGQLWVGFGPQIWVIFCEIDQSFVKMVEPVLMNHHQVGLAVLVLLNTLALHVAVSTMIVTNQNVKMGIALME